MSEPNSRPFTAASFNKYLSEGKLMASRCRSCGALYLPPRAICPSCYGEEMEWAELAGRGRLVAFTCIHVGPSFMNAEGYSRENPYCTGIVELEEGVKISARILGVDARNPSSIRIGSPGSVEFLVSGDSGARRIIVAFRIE